MLVRGCKGLGNYACNAWGVCMGLVVILPKQSFHLRANQSELESDKTDRLRELQVMLSTLGQN